MAFNTKWEPKDVAARLAAIARSGELPHNVDRDVTVTPNSRGGFNIDCQSRGGFFHDTKVTVQIHQDPVKGSFVDVKPFPNTSGNEANDVAKKLSEAFFSDKEY